jgi:hypothetical protein
MILQPGVSANAEVTETNSDYDPVAEICANNIRG